ncbi:MAG: hypothetical protein JWQ34_2023 [Mucilaginibacter sp.]|uniref:hypothetical protein n=1 Tax=Mucilaginibacter sp. TaxID=1882438 RepID=UPI002620421F|nr:hypothetical protein [Mucilaginibacter sp.]MDB5003798.1 hypothetical protein [Mucilaginibacter sp.]
MKKYFTLLLLFCSTSIFAQFKLSGKINHYSGKEPLQINIPQVFDFYPENSINIPVAKNGSFSITLPITKQKFGTLFFQQNPHLLLLSSNKKLTVELDGIDKKIKFIGGTALAENNLLDAINIEEYPFFLQNTDVYTRLNYAALNARVVKPFFATRDKKIALVNQSAISPNDKKLIASEVKYADYNLLYELTDVSAESKTAIDKMINDVFDKSNPKPDVFPAGPQYYKFVANYLDYQENRVLAQAKVQHIKGNKPIPYFGFSLDSANAIITRYGVSYIRCLSAIKYLPVPVAEQFIYQQIARSFYDNNRVKLDAIAKLFNQKFPASAYNADIRKKVKNLKGK